MKRYLKPSTEVYEVEVQNVIATSIRIVSDRNAEPELGADADERSTWGNLW
jgi:hypothetical protein